MTREERAKIARNLRAAGMGWKEIAAAIGVTDSTAHCLADPAYAVKRQARVNELRRNHRAYDDYHARRMDPDEVAARLAEIPPDTRDLTARLCGDPLPARSARYRQVEEAASTVSLPYLKFLHGRV